MSMLPSSARETIVRYPWSCLGLAFLAGAGIAFGERSRSTLFRLAALAAGSAAVAAVRELAASEFADYARTWLDERNMKQTKRATA